MTSSNYFASDLTLPDDVGAYLKRVASDTLKGYARAGVDTSGWT